jgi:hypothetical protein
LDQLEYGEPVETFWKVRRIWRDEGGYKSAAGANLVDHLTQSVMKLYNIVRECGATDVVRELRYEQVYCLIDAYFLMAVSQDVADKEALSSTHIH